MAAGLTLKTLYDELGNRWLIEAGDPGQRALNVAKELRIKKPTLPSEVCAGRPVAYPDWKPFDALLDEGNIKELRAAFVVNLIRGQLLWNT